MDTGSLKHSFDILYYMLSRYGVGILLSYLMLGAGMKRAFHHKLWLIIWQSDENSDELFACSQQLWVVLSLIIKELRRFSFQSFDLLMHRFQVRSCISVSGHNPSVDHWIISTTYQGEVTKR